VEVEGGAAKAASSALGRRFSTIRRSVDNLARADRAWRIEYCRQPRPGSEWRELRCRYLLLDTLLGRLMKCLNLRYAFHQSLTSSDDVVLTVVRTPCSRSYLSELLHVQQLADARADGHTISNSISVLRCINVLAYSLGSPS
jgi:hypothetical protein